MADTISTFATGNVQDNEIVKAADFQFAFESLVDNFSKFGRMVLEPRQNFVIGGEVYKENGMNLRVKPIYGVNHVTSVPFGCVTDSPVNVLGANEYITLAQGGDADRIDAIGVKGVWKEYDEQQRFFRDFETETDTVQNTNVKKTLTLEYEVFKGEEGSSVAPDVDSAYVKLCEVLVPANSIEIDEENIRNITTDVAGEENEDWTSQKDETYNIGFISDVNDRFRQQHNADGSHKEDVIGTDELMIGTAAKELNANVLPVAKEITVGSDKKESSASVTALLTLCASYITSLFDTYKKNGDYAFSGEVSVSDLVDSENNKLLDAFCFGTEGEDDDRYAYIKYNDKQILKILPNGTIRGTEDYEVTNTFDLVNKAITDAIASDVSSLTTRVKYLEENADPSAAINRAFNKFTKYESQVISVATTGNIALSGLQIIDGYSVNAGDYVLVKDQDNAIENGIYLAANSAWSRDIFVQNFTEGELSRYIFTIKNGTQNKNKSFYVLKDSFVTDEDEITLLENKTKDMIIDDEISSIYNTYSASKISKLFFDMIHPVGYVYPQFSGCPSPSEMKFPGTWKELKFGGVFFRSEGGDALPFTGKFKCFVSSNTISLDSSDADTRQYETLLSSYDAKRLIVIADDEYRSITEWNRSTHKITLGSAFKSPNITTVLIGQSAGIPNITASLESCGSDYGPTMSVTATNMLVNKREYNSVGFNNLPRRTGVHYDLAASAISDVFGKSERVTTDCLSVKYWKRIA